MASSRPAGCFWCTLSVALFIVTGVMLAEGLRRHIAEGDVFSLGGLILDGVALIILFLAYLMREGHVCPLRRRV